MKIKTVKIKNFRCFKDLELELQHCHALVGENGSGKTAVLEAVNLVTSGGQPYLNEQDFNSADLGDLSIEVGFDEPFLCRVPDGYTTQDIPCQSVSLNAKRRERAAPGKALSDPFVTEKHVVPIVYDEKHKPQVSLREGTSVNIPASVSATKEGYESPRKTAGSVFKFAKNRLTFQNDFVNFPDVFYFDRDREEQAKVGYNSLLQKIAKDLNWRFRKDWDQVETQKKWEEFYNLVISTVEDPKRGRIIQPVRDRMKKVVGSEFKDLELGLLDIEQPFSKTFFSKRIGTNQIDHKRLGSGISILLAYFLLETISKLSKEHIVFLIDEPELHLHPQLQRALFEEFRNSEFQTIYTTQSDSFVSVGGGCPDFRWLDEYEAIHYAAC